MATIAPAIIIIAAAQASLATATGGSSGGSGGSGNDTDGDGGDGSNSPGPHDSPTNGSDATFWAEQAVTLDEAILLWTTQPALIMGLEDRAGAIAVGKSADFVVLNQDLHQVAIDDVSETAPRQTWFRGRRVFAASP